MPSRPPDPPLGLSPRNREFAPDERPTASYFYRHPAGASSAPQFARQLRYRFDGGPWTLRDPWETRRTTFVVPEDWMQPGRETSWQVRTRTEESDWSGWSAMIGVFYTHGPATVTVTGPSVLRDPDVTITWTLPEGEHQTGYRVRILRGALTVYEHEHTPGGGYLTPPNLPMHVARDVARDGDSLTVEVQVRNGWMLWSAWASRTVSADFRRPAAPSIGQVTWDEATSSVTVSGVRASPVSGAQTPPTVALRIERRIAGGPWLPAGAEHEGTGPVEITDPIPDLLRANEWRAVAVSDIGSTMPSPPAGVGTPPVEREPGFIIGPAPEPPSRPPRPDPGLPGPPGPILTSETIGRDTGIVRHGRNQGWVLLNYGPHFERAVRVKAAADLQETSSQDRVQHTFDGRRRPLHFTHPHERWSGRLSVLLHPDPYGASDRDELYELLAWPVVCFRDPTRPAGQRRFVVIDDIQVTQRGIEQRATIAMTETDHLEDAA